MLDELPALRRRDQGRDHPGADPFQGRRGDWVDIDTRLVPGEEPGSVESVATSMTTTIGSQGVDAPPVQLSADGFSVGMDYLGGAENAKVVIGDTATYLAVSGDVNLQYEALRDCVKETLVLASCFQVPFDGHAIVVDQIRSDLKRVRFYDPWCYGRHECSTHQLWTKHAFNWHGADLPWKGVVVYGSK
jgi:hypothetical protein